MIILYLYLPTFSLYLCSRKSSKPNLNFFFLILLVFFLLFLNLLCLLLLLSFTFCILSHSFYFFCFCFIWKVFINNVKLVEIILFEKEHIWDLKIRKELYRDYCNIYSARRSKKKNDKVRKETEQIKKKLKTKLSK